MAKFKILYIITQGELGGAQRYIYDLATNLTDDFCVTIAVGEPKGRMDLQQKLQITNYKLQIIQLKHLVRNISPIHDILAIFELAKLYKTLKPDIIHLNSSKAGILGSLAKLVTYNLKLTTVYTVHGWVFNEPLGRIKKALYRWLEKLTARWKDKIIVLSNFDYQTGQQAGIPTNKLVKIPLGISPPIFLSKEKARQELSKLSSISYLPSSTLIGTIANLYPTKGIDILIEAVGLQLKTYPDRVRDPVFHRDNLQLIIIGEGPERKKLEKLIKKYQLEQIIHLIGAVDNAAQYLPAFDLFVLPSRKEGVPYTLLEAMTANVPIIATNVGGMPSLIENKKDGLLVEPKNTEQLLNAIVWAINNSEETKKRAGRAFEKTQKFTLEKMTSATSYLYPLTNHS